VENARLPLGTAFPWFLIDLDKFKESKTDTMRHFEGDLCWQRRPMLEQKSRQSNVVARYGGDEFIILRPETGADKAKGSGLNV